MSSGWIVALEMGGVLGVVIGFGVWELLGLRRDRRKSAAKVTRSETDPTR